MKEFTTIKLERETKTRLDKLKEYEKESYNKIIKKILYILNLVRKNPMFGNKMLVGIDKTIKRRQTFYKQVNKED